MIDVSRIDSKIQGPFIDRESAFLINKNKLREISWQDTDTGKTTSFVGFSFLYSICFISFFIFNIY